MTPGVSICVATFGGDEWRGLAESRAIPSARAQGVQVVAVHGVSLSKARNMALEQVETEHVIHLDADDELEPGYIAAMMQGTADVRVPRVRYIRPGSAVGPVMLRVAGHDHPQCTGDCLQWGNWIVIGAMVRTDLLRKVGGFEPWPLYEDWSTWLSCYQAGATFEPIPSAVYRAHVRRDSRNRDPDRDTRLAVHRAIARAHGVPVPQ